MVGYISEAIAAALRGWQPLKGFGIIPVRALDRGSVVINTELPAICIHIVGKDGDGNVFIGNGIRQYFDLYLHYITEITDFTFTTDNGMQRELLDKSDEIVRCMERSDLLQEVKVAHDFNMQYSRMETETSHAMRNAVSVAIDIHKICYDCSVRFDIDIGKTVDALLKRVEIDNNGINTIIIDSENEN